MGDLAVGPFLFFGEGGVIPFVPRRLGEVVFIDGGRAGGFLRVRDGYPIGGGCGPSAAGARRWVVGFLEENTAEEVLCFVPGGHGGVVLRCYVCGSALVCHGGTVFLCSCGEGFVVGVCGDPATVDGSEASGQSGAETCIGSRQRRPPASTSVRVGGHPDVDIGGAVYGAAGRPPARGGGGGGRGRGVQDGARGRGRRGHGRASPTPEGEGRRARRREANALASYKPPPAEDAEAEGALAVQPPEGDGPNQGSASVSGNNDKLTNVYGEMLSVSQAVEKYVAATKELQAEGERLQHWTSVAAGIRRLRIKIDDRLTRYDVLCDMAQTLRVLVGLDGGFPVEPPPALAIHPSSLTFKE